MTNAERFTTEELKEWEDVILTADDRSKALEHELFLGLRKEVASNASNLVNWDERLPLLTFCQHSPNTLESTLGIDQISNMIRQWKL